jgi:hypothetical protein
MNAPTSQGFYFNREQILQNDSNLTNGLHALHLPIAFARG